MCHTKDEAMARTHLLAKRLYPSAATFPSCKVRTANVHTMCKVLGVPCVLEVVSACAISELGCISNNNAYQSQCLQNKARHRLSSNPLAEAVCVCYISDVSGRNSLVWQHALVFDCHVVGPCQDTFDG